MRCPAHRLSLSRRQMLAGSIAALLTQPAHAADALPVFKVGYLPFGTVQWEIDALVGNGFDVANGIKIEMRPLVTNEAARIAFLSGTVDTVVQDLLFAARLKADGKPVFFLPQSSTEGELIVPDASPIKAIADLKGRSLGIAGGPVDKNWLFLRAAALEQDKLDLTEAARTIFGAPPLLAAKLERGEIDAGLLYWSTAARLKPKGFRKVTSTGEILTSLGAKGPIAATGYILSGRTDGKVLAAFARALRQTEHLLATSPDAWAKIRPVMKAPDEATFEALKSAYLRGIPSKPRAEEVADARSFFALVRRIGGDALLGPARDVPDDLYVAPSIYG